MNASSHPRARETGAALLIVMLVVFLASASYFLTELNVAGYRASQDRTTAAVMAEAKSALLGRAANDSSLPGSLPCPDTNDDGSADGVGGNCTSYLGRFPWKTLNTAELVDGNGDHLWYALSSNLKDNASSSPLNPSNALLLSIDASVNIAAIIFSPGSQLSGQSRPSNAQGNYLEGSNADGDNAFVTAPPSSTFNDIALTITRSELFRVVNRRVLGEIRGPDDSSPALPNWGLRRYYADNGYFPFADTNNDGLGDAGNTTGGLPNNDLTLSPVVVPWLITNNWKSVITYNRLSPNQVILSIGSDSITVKPCPSSPCQ